MEDLRDVRPEYEAAILKMREYWGHGEPGHPENGFVEHTEPDGSFSMSLCPYCLSEQRNDRRWELIAELDAARGVT